MKHLLFVASSNTQLKNRLLFGLCPENFAIVVILSLTNKTLVS